MYVGRDYAVMGENENRVARFDAARLDQAFSKTDEGFLRAIATLTRVGVFVYQNGDGTVRRELRPPEEVFDEASLESLRMAPVTLRHPPREENGGLVTADTARAHQRGSLGELISHDAYYVQAPIMVTDGEAVAAVENGEAAEVSAGYTMRSDATPGEWLGQSYDIVQRDIRYNHVALVPSGRAGQRAHVHLDAADAIQCAAGEGETMPDDKNGPQLRTVTLDGVQYQAEPAVLEKLHAAQSRADHLEKNTVARDEYTRLEAERDQIRDERDRLKQESEERGDAETIKAVVDERIAVVDVARRVLPAETIDEHDLYGMDADAVRRMVVAHKSPKVNLDDKDSVYVRARFDAIAEALPDEAARDARRRTHQVPDTDGEKDKVVDARDRYIEALRSKDGRAKVKEAVNGQ